MRKEEEHLFSIVALCALGLEDLSALLHVSGLYSHVRLWDGHFKVAWMTSVIQSWDVRGRLLRFKMCHLRFITTAEPGTARGEGKGQGEDKASTGGRLARIHCRCCTLHYNVAHGQAKPRIYTVKQCPTT